MSEVEKFREESLSRNLAAQQDSHLFEKSIEWMRLADEYKYTYNFTWMGIPIIKFPNDMIVQQEIMARVRPDLIIETGVAHGGSVVFSAAMQEMLGIDGKVLGIDIDIRKHNRIEIEKNRFISRIVLIEGDSTGKEVLSQVEIHVREAKKILVILDSLHSHEHVLKELLAYSKFVSIDSYIILPDTFIEFFPKGYYSSSRPWDVGDNPYTAMKAFLADDSSFEIDSEFARKALITETIDGYLKRVK
jgi:cephalosporin hydroxylase